MIRFSLYLKGLGGSWSCPKEIIVTSMNNDFQYYPDIFVDDGKES